MRKLEKLVISIFWFNRYWRGSKTYISSRVVAVENFETKRYPNDVILTLKNLWYLKVRPVGRYVGLTNAAVPSH